MHLLNSIYLLWLFGNHRFSGCKHADSSCSLFCSDSTHSTCSFLCFDLYSYSPMYCILVFLLNSTNFTLIGNCKFDREERKSDGRKQVCLIELISIKNSFKLKN